jgi:hypothetical protein
MPMTKSDRQQLQTLVRRRFKALKSEVIQRQAELLAQMEASIAERYKEEDQAWTAARSEINEAILECNRKVNDAWRRCLGDKHEEAEYVRLIAAPGRDSNGERMQLRRAAVARVEEQVKRAIGQLETRELDLLEKLLIEGLESDDARRFLGEVPTAAELVPASRLELMTGMTGDAAGG